MPPTADQVSQINNLVQMYKTHVRAAVSKHKATVIKVAEELDKRQTKRILKQLGKV